MKKLHVISIIFLMILIKTLFSQSYFGDVNNVTLYYPQSFQGGTIYFGLEEINTAYLDIAITQLQQVTRYGQWNLNNGNGTYGEYNLFNNQGSGNLIGNVFVKLRSASTKKDLIVGRNDGLEVRINDGGSIGGPNSYYGGPNWTYIEAGIFSSNDISEDVLFSNGTNRLYYFVNNNNGTLQGPKLH